MKKADLVVIDDEFPVLYTIQAILENDHPGLVTFQNPLEGLEHISRAGCRVLLTDLKMPGLDGLEVLQRALRVDPDIQVIMLTAHGSEKIAVEALKRNAYHYITKPFDHEELKLVVRKALEQYELRKRIQYDLEMAAALQANLLPQQPFTSEHFQIDPAQEQSMPANLTSNRLPPNISKSTSSTCRAETWEATTSTSCACPAGPWGSSSPTLPATESRPP